MSDKSKQDNNEVHVEQLNTETKLTDLEKTAVLEYVQDVEEDLSKTQQFKLLNSRNSKNIVKTVKINDEEIELPAKKVSLGETIRIKISDLRAKIEEDVELPTLKKKKSLYDTVIIKLDDLINSRNALKRNQLNKITNIEETNHEKKFHLFKPRDITKLKNIELNVDSEEFGRQLYNLNKIALANLSSSNNNQKVRKDTIASRIGKIEKVHVSKDNFLKYQSDLNKFAINKLYYKFAPKETKKYKIYKYGVILSSFVLIFTGAIIANWFIQGFSINNLSNAIKEETPIVEVIDEGLIFNMEDPTGEHDAPINDKTSQYWKYLNTPLSSVDFTDLLKQNKDTVAWIIVNNTNINYPVVQTSDNNYYLKHSFDKSSNNAGWVFADFRDNFNNFNDNMVIYAHGRKDRVMFGSLGDALKEKWYKNEDNQIIQLSTIKYNTMWQIFSVYKIQAESYYITTDFSSNASYQKFLDTMKERSIYDFGVDVNTKDKILTLSTCYNNNGVRIVVQAKLVKIQER